MATAASARESAQPPLLPPGAQLPASCPLREPSTLAAYRTALKAGSHLSLATQSFLSQKGSKATGEWLKDVLRQSRTVFQPWSMEVLLLVGVLGAARFGELEALLGASSRTLSAKLRSLAQAGLLERQVEPGPPVQVRYRLTKAGRATAAAASPLFAHLNLLALGAPAARAPPGAGPAGAPPFARVKSRAH